MTTTPEQIEAVARAAYERWRTTRPNAPLFDSLCADAMESELVSARAAINAMRPFIRAEALEEAVKVADQMQDLHPMDDFDTGWTAGLHECSAAIRALKEKP